MMGRCRRNGPRRRPNNTNRGGGCSGTSVGGYPGKLFDASSPTSSPSSSSVVSGRTCSSLPSPFEETTTTAATSSAAATMATIRSSPPNEELIQSRRHLVGVYVQQKNSVMIYGLLPDQKCQGQQLQPSTRNVVSPVAARTSQSSAKSVHDIFSRYGKICKCVLNPRGLPTPHFPHDSPDCLAVTKKPGAVVTNSKLTTTAYITYSNEKGASNAIREADMSIIGGQQIRVTRAVTRYCDDFLQGLHCESLDCILLHELVCTQNYNNQHRITPPAKAIGNAVHQMGSSGMNDKRKNAWNMSPGGLLHSPNLSVVQKESTAENFFHASNEGNGGQSYENTSRKTPIARSVTPSPTNSLEMNSSILTPKTNELVSNRSKAYSNQVTSLPDQNNQHLCRSQLPAARQLFKNTNKPKNCAVSPPRIDIPGLSTQTRKGYNNPWDIQSPIVITGRQSTPVKVHFNRMYPDFSERAPCDDDSPLPLNLSPPRIKSMSRHDHVTDTMPMQLVPPPIGGNVIFPGSNNATSFNINLQKNDQSSMLTSTKVGPANSALDSCNVPIEYSIDMGTLLSFAGVGKTPTRLPKQSLSKSPEKSINFNVPGSGIEEKKEQEEMSWPSSQANPNQNTFLQRNDCSRGDSVPHQLFQTSTIPSQMCLVGRNTPPSFMPYDYHNYQQQFHPQYQHYGQSNVAMNRIAGTYPHPFMQYSQHRSHNDFYLQQGGGNHRFSQSYFRYPQQGFVRHS